MSTVIQADILVVGAGPVGAAAALALSQISNELKVVLLDRTEAVSLPETTLDTRVFAINSGSRILLEQIGVWEDILAARACAYERMYVWDAQGTGSIEFTATEMDVPELGHIIEAGLIQNALNKALSQAANVEIVRPVEIADFSASSSNSSALSNKAAHIALKNGDDIDVKLVIAADGARSQLRDLVGIHTRDEDCQQQAVIANIALELPHENCAWQIFRPTGPLAFLPLETDQHGGQVCSIVWTLDQIEAERVQSLSDVAFERELMLAVESRFGKLKLLSARQSFPLIQRHAERYSDQSIVLVGDAAHNIHPLAGLGANLGFQDVRALYTELKRAHDRGLPLSDQNVLSRYQRQRRLDNELTLQAMSFFRRGFADQGLAINALRNLGLKTFSKFPAVKNFVAKQALMSN